MGRGGKASVSIPLHKNFFLSELPTITNLNRHKNKANQVIGIEFLFTARYPNDILFFPSQRERE